MLTAVEATVLIRARPHPSKKVALLVFGACSDIDLREDAIRSIKGFMIYALYFMFSDIDLREDSIKGIKGLYGLGVMLYGM